MTGNKKFQIKKCLILPRRLIMLKKSIHSLIQIIEAKKKDRELFLTTKEKKLLRDAANYPSINNREALENILLNAKRSHQNSDSSLEPSIFYPGGISFQEFRDTGCLKKVANHVGKQDVYLYFNEKFIRDFNSLSPIDQDKFRSVCKEEFLQFAAANNEKGLKHLKKEGKIKVQCRAKIGREEAVLPFSTEIKVNGTTDRILAYTLKPTEPGPEILVATHALLKGLHDNRYNQKTFYSNDLEAALAAPAHRLCQTASLNKAGFFAKANPAKIPQKDFVAAPHYTLSVKA